MAARLSAVAAIATVIIAILIEGHGEQSLQAVFWYGLLRIVFMVGGLTLAIIAIVGSIPPRPRPLLAYATMGLLVNGGAILLAVFSFISLVAASGTPPERPPVIASDPIIPVPVDSATQVHCDNLNYSISIPAGYQDNPEALRNPLVDFGFFKQGPTGIRTDINIQPLGRTIERGPISDTDLQIIEDQLPPDSQVERTTEQWHNQTIAGLHYRIPHGDEVVAVFTARVPLEKEAIQINVGGPIAGELEYRSTLRTLLNSLVGDSNWDAPAALPGIHD